jgi:hypothetical protein
MTMNRIYSLAALVLIGGSLSAQRVNNVKLQGFNKLQPAAFDLHPEAHPLDLQSGQRDILFSEDFANGLAGNNGVGAWTTSGPNGDVWRHSLTGPVGAYTTPDEIIESPTVANGYMLFNSDSVNTNWSDTTIVATPVALTGSLVSPVIDLSANPYVQLKFSEEFRFCCSDGTPGHFVDISTDNFATWTRVNVENGIVDNTDSGTLLYSVNLTGGIAGNPANAQFRFTQDGANGITHYHWQIDDISIESLPPNDLKVLNAATTTWDFNTANTYDSVYYTMFPVSELRPLALNMTYYNNGSANGADVQANISVDDGYNQTTTASTLAPGDTAVAQAGQNGLADYTPTATLGDHNMTFTVSGDSTDAAASDNVATAKIKVTGHVYARDEDSRDGGYNDNDQGDAFKLGNKFYCNVDETVYAIDVAFSIASATGVELNCQILDASDGTYPPLFETDYYTITDWDRTPLGGNHMVHFAFDTPVQLTAGSDYVVVVQHFGGANVLIGTSGTSQAQTSNFYRQSNDTWYYVTSTPMVRLNFDATFGIDKTDYQNGVGMGQNYPNPANNGSTRIDVNLQQSAHVNMVLRDISGKLVQTLEDRTMAPGLHHVDVNTANLGAGVYFYTLTTNNMTSTKRMTVVR